MKRYAPRGQAFNAPMLEHEHGPYVRYDDYAALDAECKRLRGWVLGLEKDLEQAGMPKFKEPT